ncbi:hypothetical protein MTO96_002074 [Rhipicephalus appendiculatus]
MAILASQDLFATVAAWCGTWPVIFAVVAITLGGLLTVKGLANSARQKRKRLPPGPKGLPLLGYLPFIWKPYHVAFREISEKYGPIIRLQLGIKDVVVLNEVATVREALTNPDLLYRPDDFMFRYLGVKGIAGINGEAWLVNHSPLAASVANNISALVFGRRYDLEDPEGRFFVGLLSTFLRHAKLFWVMDFLPALRVITSYIPGSRLYIMNYVAEELTKLVRAEVKERDGNMENYADRDFIDGYLRKIQESKGTDSHYTTKYLEGNAINFYGPGTNPVRTVTLWSLYIAASDPDGMQARVQQEIDSVVGRQRTPAWEDRVNMPYTMASILETMRWRTPTPLSLHRARACPGETLALIEVFLYLTTVLQKFKVLPEEGKTLCLDAKHALLSLVDETQPLRFIPR